MNAVGIARKVENTPAESLSVGNVHGQGIAQGVGMTGTSEQQSWRRGKCLWGARSSGHREKLESLLLLGLHVEYRTPVWLLGLCKWQARAGITRGKAKVEVKLMVLVFAAAK